MGINLFKMKSSRFLLPLILIFLISCNKEKPESGKALVTVEGIDLSAPSTGGARILADEVWEHPLPPNFFLVFSSKESGQSYPIQFSSDFGNSSSSFELPFGIYSYESSPIQEQASTTLPIQFGGNLTVNSSQVKTRLSGVSDFQLLSFQKNNLGGIPKTILPQTLPLGSKGNYYFVYAKSQSPVTVEIPLSNGKSFRWGWDAQAFSHRGFYFQRETGDPPPALISDPYFTYLNQVITLKNNGFPEQLNPYRVRTLAEGLKETSGLQWIVNRLFSINDGGNFAEIQEINPDTGLILRTIQVSNAPNVDWEDLAAGPDFLYIGDFGNNGGTRKDLKILRIPIQSVLNQTQVQAEVINFIYQDPSGAANADLPYDCEAMVFLGGKIYLFTKETSTNESGIFAIDDIPGNRIAQRIGVFEATGKLTGADLSPDGKSLVFIGYETTGFNSRSFILAYPNTLPAAIPSSSTAYSFYLGSVSQTSQTEGIALFSSEKIKISGEQISVGGLTVPPRLMEIDLKGILD
ncbi:hypothetical protein DFQ04_1524 [Algoriphagus boseongensis]|uniref:WD40 repeat protein n=2 Tax=Algoriphagus boseongensis TaxID=1442587 RepID=A0A4R6TBV1_9BACT|nr:hypothetical protein DFQ04_1524 [Algoriphagus boseongensis]